MNSLNLLSSRVSTPQTPSSSRSNSLGNILSTTITADPETIPADDVYNEKEEVRLASSDHGKHDKVSLQETTPLLSKELLSSQPPATSQWRLIPGKLASTMWNSVRWVLVTIATPGVYIVRCFYDDTGKFALLYPIRKIGAFCFGSSRSVSTTQALGISSTKHVESTEGAGSPQSRHGSARSGKLLGSVSSSESETDQDRSMSESDASSARHTKSRSSQNEEETPPTRRSIRIKLNNESNMRQRKHRKTNSTSSQSNGSGAISAGEIAAATLKSPTSPAASLLITKYPRAPAPPRPLIPRRQPSYTLSELPRSSSKTLIIDLDETLIHSMAKGGRMSTGHMVEVKLNLAGGPGGPQIGSQVPILYYVHKRPHCDDFLRKVSLG